MLHISAPPKSRISKWLLRVREVEGFRIITGLPKNVVFPIVAFAIETATRSISNGGTGGGGGCCSSRPDTRPMCTPVHQYRPQCSQHTKCTNRTEHPSNRPPSQNKKRGYLWGATGSSHTHSAMHEHVPSREPRACGWTGVHMVDLPLLS